MHPASARFATPLLLGLALIAGPVHAQTVVGERLATERLDLRLERIADGLTHPWAVAQLPDGDFLVSERPGRMARLDESGTITHLKGVPEVSTRGQGGLLDVVLHPRFGENESGEHDWIYFTWSQPGSGGTATTLSRARLADDALTEVEALFVQNRFSSPGRHYGSRLAWLPDGTLLMSIGERGTPPRAQDASDHAGSVLRLTETGEAAPDNPFVNDPDALDALYTTGNRNVQGLTVRHDGEPWASEHGPRTGDELNRLVGGENYGWPEVSRGNDYATNQPIGADSLPGMRDPVHVFEGRFAPSGLAEVTSDAFGAWYGDLLAGGLSSETLLRLRLDGDDVIEREAILEGEIGRIRDVRQGRDGAIYLLSDAPDGGLYRLRPTD
ncbi:PQQ-dependent sugar dehydrogenase [Halomonas faecis]|uniref:PQQ-dependent sugar dehydrogenase n=1 Tax=Halomonas faecis TaxID=1562110 RepID=UPI0013D217E6|nr:PQQ-dependent sugar dehydrogenase [Halomonas faecis]